MLTLDGTYYRPVDSPVGCAHTRRCDSTYATERYANTLRTALSGVLTPGGHYWPVDGPVGLAHTRLWQVPNSTQPNLSPLPLPLLPHRGPPSRVRSRSATRTAKLSRGTQQKRQTSSPRIALSGVLTLSGNNTTPPTLQQHRQRPVGGPGGFAHTWLSYWADLLRRVTHHQYVHAPVDTPAGWSHTVVLGTRPFGAGSV